MTHAKESLTLLYRGSLSSCNYACEYCPFGKTAFDVEALKADSLELERFVNHIEQGQYADLSLMFIPWGEALIHKHYQQAMIRLSRVFAIRTVVTQTSLTVRPDWLRDSHAEKIAFWCTFHPTQTTLDAFLSRLDVLNVRSIRYSVGIVGRDDFYDVGLQLRKKLPPHVALWVNPLDDDIDAYTPDRIKQWSQIDPVFSHTAKKRLTKDTKCRCGTSVFTVSGNGDMRRCPFVNEIIGNLYENEIPTITEHCPNEQCNCYIGYAHWESDSFRDMYGDNILVRSAKS